MIFCKVHGLLAKEYSVFGLILFYCGGERSISLFNRNSSLLSYYHLPHVIQILLMALSYVTQNLSFTLYNNIMLAVSYG